MKKVVEATSWRIIIEPRFRLSSSKKVVKSNLDDIVGSILRHVDGVSRRDIDVQIDDTVECSFCGREWADLSSEYNDCCAEDRRSNPETES